MPSTNENPPHAPDALIERLAAHAHPVPRPLGAGSWAWRWGLACLALVGGVGFALGGWRADFAKAIARGDVILATLGAVITMMAAGVSLRYAALPGQVAPRFWRACRDVGFALVLISACVGDFRAGDAARAWSLPGLRCVAGWLVFTVPSALLAWAHVRRGAPTRLRDAARTVMMAAGAVGVWGITWHCPNPEAMHAALFHVLPWAAAVVLAAGWGKALFAW